MDIQSSTSSSTASESSTPAPSQTLAPWAGQYIKTGGKRACVSCSYCARDITSSCRMRCAICVSVSVNTHNRYTSKSVQAPVELCADCFASGVSFEDHVPTHAYQVRSWLLSFSLVFTKEVFDFGRLWIVSANFLCSYLIGLLTRSCCC